MEPVSAPSATDRAQEILAGLDVVEGKEQRGKGRGSLENPERYENVPGHVIPILEREFDDFDTEAEQFLAGDTPEDQFIGFRLKQGSRCHGVCGLGADSSFVIRCASEIR